MPESLTSPRMRKIPSHGCDHASLYRGFLDAQPVHCTCGDRRWHHERTGAVKVPALLTVASFSLVTIQAELFIATESPLPISSPSTTRRNHSLHLGRARS